MGPPRTRAQNLAAQSRSRFLEGSMNDRASAVPPVAFTGLSPAELAALERPAFAEGMHRPSDSKHHGRRPARMRLGMVWEGVRGKLRLRKETPDDSNNAVGEKKPEDQATSDEGKPPGPSDRPTREEVLASYHQLMAAGFFANHAVQSTRQPPPATRPATSHDPNHRQTPPPSYRNGARDAPLSPQWPLTPKASRGSTPPTQQPFCSPVSIASSRGTKRAAAEGPDEGDAAGRSPLAGDEDLSTLAHRFLPKRLRRTASRDISLPRMRSTIRSVSATNSAAAAAAAAGPVPTAVSPSSVSSGPSTEDESLDTGMRFGTVPRHMGGLRNLRPRLIGGPLSVVPDVNRGIPRVPTIPTKFAAAGGRADDR